MVGAISLRNIDKEIFINMGIFFMVIIVNLQSRTGLIFGQEGRTKTISEDPDLEYALIDGTIVQVHQRATGSKGGHSIRPLGARAVG